jgi:hypothetical protein
MFTDAPEVREIVTFPFDASLIVDVKTAVLFAE